MDEKKIQEETDRKFKALDEDFQQADKELKELRDQLQEKNITLNITSAARQWLAEKGYDRKMGARPMARVIQTQLKKPLADELLFGKLVDGHGDINVNLEQGGLKINIIQKTSCELIE